MAAFPEKFHVLWTKYFVNQYILFTFAPQKPLNSVLSHSKAIILGMVP
jgi:hypothetical protein